MAASTVLIRYNGADITSNVLFESAVFSTVANGGVGSFEFTVKDPSSTLSFVTGKEVTLSLDGTVVFGGYLTQVGRRFAFPDKTSGTRQWVLRGVDYNIIFDRRVLRRTNGYTRGLPLVAKTTYDGAAIRYALNNYFDLTGFTWNNTTIDDVALYTADSGKKGAYPQQGTTLRELFSGPAERTGAVFYIAADKKIHYHALEETTSSWGFSDAPNGTTTFKMRDLDMVEDGSLIVNDAMVWGGSQWAGSGGTVFARSQNSTSQGTYGRWQIGETHFGEEGYGIQAGVTARAGVIVNGPPGIGVGVGGNMEQKGLKLPQWQLTFSWWLHDVPNAPIPGYVYTITNVAFNVTQVLPLRSLTITFPKLDGSGKAWVQMRGDFNISMNDQQSLWTYLRRNQKRLLTSVVGSVDDTADSTIYGAYGSFKSSITNVSGLTYQLPFGYIPGTLMVFVGGLALAPVTGFTETDNVEGTFTLTSTPTGAIHVTCRTLSA